MGTYKPPTWEKEAPGVYHFGPYKVQRARNWLTGQHVYDVWRWEGHYEGEQYRPRYVRCVSCPTLAAAKRATEKRPRPRVLIGAQY